MQTKKLGTAEEALTDRKLLSLRRGLIGEVDTYYATVESLCIFDQEVLKPSVDILLGRVLADFSEDPTEAHFKRLMAGIPKSAWEVMRDRTDWVVKRFREVSDGRFPYEEARAALQSNMFPRRRVSSAKLREAIRDLNPWEKLVFQLRSRIRGNPAHMAKLLGMTPEEVVSANAKIERIYHA